LLFLLIAFVQKDEIKAELLSDEIVEVLFFVGELAFDEEHAVAYAPLVIGATLS
jgi:hypothetical protein